MSGNAVVADTFLGMNEVHAVFITALVAAVIACWGILSQRDLAARQATLDMITASEADRELIGARMIFIRLAKESGGLAVWAEPEKEGTEEAQAIRLVLNQFELAAIGISRNILDYQLYARWCGSSAKKVWEHADPYVRLLRQRQGKNTYFGEFESLIERINVDPPRHKNKKSAKS